MRSRCLISGTPALSARTTDPDGATTKGQFEVTADPAYADTTYSYGRDRGGRLREHRGVGVRVARETAVLIVEILQVVLVIAVLVLATGTRTSNPLLLWTALGFGTGQVIAALDGKLADTFFRLFVAVFATLVLDTWRTERAVTVWLAGPAALLSGLLIGWAV
ncbi:hypothetical protein [Streptomyces sp. NPDC046870]|uniref:hypothetical protein n=1 Tax=Streptomyces sp. NPDC046870 TaxID=3155135 RepID=UPI0034531D1E